MRNIQRQSNQIRGKRPLVQTLFPIVEPSELPTRPIPVIPQFSDLHELQEWFAFASQLFADFRTTASVMPSSPHLAREMVAPACTETSRVVVEFGPGTGPMTTQLLQQLPADARIYCFEINPHFVSYLESHFADDRLNVLCTGAQNAPDVLASNNESHADGVVSSLPLSFFPGDLRHTILGAAASCLRPGGVFTQFQYASGLDCSGRFPKPYDLRPLLRRYFARVERRLVWMNFPPAWVYHCYRDDC